MSSSSHPSTTPCTIDFITLTEYKSKIIVDNPSPAGLPNPTIMTGTDSYQQLTLSYGSFFSPWSSSTASAQVWWD
ncbi:hypothetical protein Hdeb2414_s0023g00629641 [Helianthus debilis subsp. tardiflorus]